MKTVNTEKAIMVECNLCSEEFGAVEGKPGKCPECGLKYDWDKRGSQWIIKWAPIKIIGY